MNELAIAPAVTRLFAQVAALARDWFAAICLEIFRALAHIWTLAIESATIASCTWPNGAAGGGSRRSWM
jgi:hypothetical protein